MKVKMLIALAATTMFAASFALADPQSMQTADGSAAMQAAPGGENIGSPNPSNEQPMLSDNSSITGAQMPTDPTGSDEMTADNATGDDY